MDSHDTQRNTPSIPNYKDEFVYKQSVAFMLSFHRGFKRLMSSFYFDNADQGPPENPPESVTSGSCGDGWVCEHRWPIIANMVKVKITQPRNSPKHHFLIAVCKQNGRAQHAQLPDEARLFRI